MAPAGAEARAQDTAARVDRRRKRKERVAMFVPHVAMEKEKDLLTAWIKGYVNFYEMVNIYNKKNICLNEPII